MDPETQLLFLHLNLVSDRNFIMNYILRQKATDPYIYMANQTLVSLRSNGSHKLAYITSSDAPGWFANTLFCVHFESAKDAKAHEEEESIELHQCHLRNNVGSSYQYRSR